MNWIQIYLAGIPISFGLMMMALAVVDEPPEGIGWLLFVVVALVWPAGAIVGALLVLAMIRKT